VFFHHGDAPNGPLPLNSRHAAHSVQKMQRRPLTWRIFSPRAHKRKTILQLRRLWHCGGASLSIIIQAPKLPQRQINS
jgi:hypothetical protein